MYVYIATFTNLHLAQFAVSTYLWFKVADIICQCPSMQSPSTTTFLAFCNAIIKLDNIYASTERKHFNIESKHIQLNAI